MNNSFDQLIEKWAPVLNEESAGQITDHHRKAVTAAILENQERAMTEERGAMGGFLTETGPTNSVGGTGIKLGSNPNLTSTSCNAKP